MSDGDGSYFDPQLKADMYLYSTVYSCQFIILLHKCVDSIHRY